MTVNIRKGAKRVLILVLVGWWLRCAYHFADGCWLRTGAALTLDQCATADWLDLAVGAIIMPMSLLIVFVIANIVVNWLIDGFSSPGKK